MSGCPTVGRPMKQQIVCNPLGVNGALVGRGTKGTAGYGGTTLVTVKDKDIDWRDSSNHTRCFYHMGVCSYLTQSPTCYR